MFQRRSIRPRTNEVTVVVRAITPPPFANFLIFPAGIPTMQMVVLGVPAGVGDATHIGMTALVSPVARGRGASSGNLKRTAGLHH